MTDTGPDPFLLARRQLDRDRERARQCPQRLGPHLLARKLERMRGSPFAFLRGSAPLFYEALAGARDLRGGPAGRGWIVGDAHLENFGVFRPCTFAQDAGGERAGQAPRVVFAPNDFDEAVVGPLRYDVLRLATSVLLLGRERGIDATAGLAGAGAMLRAHSRQLFSRAPRLPAPPPRIARLLAAAASRKRAAFLAARTEPGNGHRRFVRGDRYLGVSRSLAARARAAFARYLAQLSPDDRPTAAEGRVVDVAFRVAGTGSLGSLRLAVLVAGRGEPDGCFVFEMKEAAPPAAAVLLGARALAALEPNERVLAGARACLRFPPRLLGTASVGGRPMVVRRLAPQEDKLDAAAFDGEALAPMASYCGALLGDAHRRGAVALPPRPWAEAERHQLLAAAVRCAALHTAAWLAYFDLLR
jgi:uncharacterized protein (DUF2252 family)